MEKKMTKSNYVHILLIIDISGSMMMIRDDMSGGINALIQDQQKIEGEATISLYEFDHNIEKKYDFENLKDIGADYSLAPCGGTALLDAVGIAFQETGAKLASMDENERPSVVVVQIVTDGMENASKEYSWDQIRSMIQEQKDKYGWDIKFLGSDITTKETGNKMGLNADDVIEYTSGNATAINSMYSGKISRMRNVLANSVNDVNLVSAKDAMKYTEADRNELKS